MKRVLLVSRNTLFGKGMETLLRQTAELEISVCAADESEAIERIEALRPDVVVLEHVKCATGPGHPLRRMLRAYEHLKVIELDPQDNTIWIYSSRQQVCMEVPDLVAAIEDSDSL